MKLEDIFRIIKTWLPIAKSKIKESASQLDVTTINDNLDEILPTKLIARLNQKISSLPIYDIYLELLIDKIIHYKKKWLEDLSAKNKNCIVIKGKCVDNLSDILTQIFQKKDILLAEEDDIEYHILTIENINLSKHKRLELLTKELDKIKFISHKSIIIIPDLSSYFSRTIKGLETLEILLNLIDIDEKKLWIIGCNDWLWLFLSKIYRWDGYIEEVWDLPSLSAENLQTLMQPVLNLVELDWHNLKKYIVKLTNQKEDENTTIKNLKQEYFKILGDLSQGCFSIAVQLCFYSFRYSKEDNNFSSLIIKNPRFPDFPKITQSDRYILFCLGLHNHLNKQDLAFILGDDEIYITSQIKCLVNLNLILFLDSNNMILNPIYYYKLKQDLEYNHFLV